LRAKLIKIYVKIFQIILVVLIVILAISTVLIPEAVSRMNPDSPLAPILRGLSQDHFYNSPLNLTLWLMLCVVILLAIFFKCMPGFAKKCLHFLLVAIFLLIIYDKTVNQRFFIAIREGQEVNFASFLKKPSATYDIPLRLLKFDIQLHSGSNIPAEFTSRLLVNRTDTTVLAINRPLAIGQFRLYQNAYNLEYLIKIISDRDTLDTPFNTPFILNQQEIVIRDLDKGTGRLLVAVDKAEYRIVPNEVSNLAGRRIKFDGPSPKYTSIIEVADVTGIDILLLFGLIYLVVLAYLLGWKQSNIR